MKISTFYQQYYCLKQDSLDIDIHMQNVKDMADVYEKKEKGIRVQSMLFFRTIYPLDKFFLEILY